MYRIVPLYIGPSWNLPQPLNERLLEDPFRIFPSNFDASWGSILRHHMPSLDGRYPIQLLNTSTEVDGPAVFCSSAGVDSW